MADLSLFAVTPLEVAIPAGVADEVVEAFRQVLESKSIVSDVGRHIESCMVHFVPGQPEQTYADFAKWAQESADNLA